MTILRRRRCYRYFLCCFAAVLLLVLPLQLLLQQARASTSSARHLGAFHRENILIRVSVKKFASKILVTGI